jgi:IgA Peptidase M64
MAEPVELHGKLSGTAVTLNLLILPDGYTAADETRFWSDAAAIKNKMLTTLPFAAFVSAITIVAMFVPSVDTLTDVTDAGRCTMPVKDTAFRARFCRKQAADGTNIARSLWGEQNLIDAVIKNTPKLAAKNWHTLMLVNSSADGGTQTGRTVWVSKSSRFLDTVVHELGHSFGDLADEYDTEGPVRHSSHEPAEPNITVQTTRTGLANYVQTNEQKFVLLVWQGLVDRADELPRGTNPLCAPQANTSADAAIAAAGGPIALYEGADHSPCDVYRPGPGCRMRYSYLEFCRVCNRVLAAKLGGYALSLKPVFPSTSPRQVRIGAWTTLASYTDADRARIVVYEATKGGYQIIRSPIMLFSNDSPVISPPDARIDTGFDFVVPFNLGGQQYVMAQSVASGRRVFYRIDETGGVPNPSATLTATWDSGVGGAVWTHLGVFFFGGVPHIFSYAGWSGAFAVERIEADNAQPRLVWGTGVDLSALFQPGWTHIVTMDISGAPFVLAYDARSGSMQIQSLTPPGRGPNTFIAPASFWGAGVGSIQPFGSNQVYLLRTRPLAAKATLDLVRPGGFGVDMIVQLPIGPGVTHVAEVHLPAGSPYAVGDANYLMLYSSLTGTASFYESV